MRTYRVTLQRPGAKQGSKTLSFMREVEDHQRSDDAMHAAMMAHPEMVATHAKLVSRGKLGSEWPMLAQGIVH